MRVRTLAIPIRCTDFSDSSQIVSFFTRRQGVVNGIAKGAYRIKNSFQGPFDLLTLVEVDLVRKPGREILSIVAEGIPLDGFRGLRREWNRYLAAAHILDFLRAVETPEEPSKDLFDSTVWTLRRIAATDSRAELFEYLAAFELRAFRCLGLGGEIDCCADCARPWTQGRRAVFFSVESAGVLCQACRSRRPEVRGRLVPGELVQKINRLGRWPAVDVPQSSSVVCGDRGVNRALRELLSELRVFLLERRFPVLEYTASFF